MGYQKGQEDRDERDNRFFYAAQIQDNENQQNKHCEFDPVGKPAGRKKAEHRIGTAGNRECDRENIIDEQRASGNHADLR